MSRTACFRGSRSGRFVRWPTPSGSSCRSRRRSLRGASIERQIDWRHATLVEAVLERLAQPRMGNGGRVLVQRLRRPRIGGHPRAGSPEARALLIVETKSDLRNVQETLHALDVKLRVVPRLVRAERGWQADAVGVVMVLADLRVERQRVEPPSVDLRCRASGAHRRGQAMAGTARRPASRPLVSADFSAHGRYAGTGGPRSGSARRRPSRACRDRPWEGWRELRSWLWPQAAP